MLDQIAGSSSLYITSSSNYISLSNGFFSANAHNCLVANSIPSHFSSSFNISSPSFSTSLTSFSSFSPIHYFSTEEKKYTLNKKLYQNSCTQHLESDNLKNSLIAKNPERKETDEEDKEDKSSKQVIHKDLQFFKNILTESNEKEQNILTTNTLNFEENENFKKCAQQIFIKFMAELVENIARNFYYFHTNLHVLHVGQIECNDYIDNILERYSFKYRDLIIYTLKKLIGSKMHYFITNEVEDLQETIKFYDIFHIMFVCPPEKLPTNLIQWWLIWYEDVVDFSTKRIEDDLSKQIDLLFDGDDEQVNCIDSNLCRLLCRCRFDIWLKSVKRITQNDERNKDFLDAMEVGFKFLKMALEELYTLRCNAYFNGLKLLEQNVCFLDSYYKDYPTLRKSIQLLKGDLKVTKVCSCDFKEHFISRVFWSCLKEPVDINSHWSLFVEDEGVLWSDKTINLLDKIFIILCNSSAHLRPLKIIELMDEGKIEEEFPLYLYPHVIDVLFLCGSLAQLTDSGSLYRVKVLLKYGKTLLKYGEEEIGWMYIKEAEAHDSTHAEILFLLEEFIEQNGSSYSSFLLAERKLKNFNFFLSNPNKLNFLILNFAKRKANEFIAKGDIGLGESIKFALHYEKYMLIIYKDLPPNNGYFIGNIINEYLKKGLEKWFKIVDIFQDNWKNFDEILLGKDVKSEIFIFFRKYCRIIPIIQIFEEKINEPTSAESKAQWIKQNRGILRSVVYLLYRMCELKCIPKYALPILFKQAVLFMQGIKYKGEYIISQEDLREVWVAYRSFKNFLLLNNQNDTTGIDELISAKIMKCKTKVLPQSFMQLNDMQIIYNYVENL